MCNIAHRPYEDKYYYENSTVYLTSRTSPKYKVDYITFCMVDVLYLLSLRELKFTLFNWLLFPFTCIPFILTFCHFTYGWRLLSSISFSVFADISRGKRQSVYLFRANTENPLAMLLMICERIGKVKGFIKKLFYSINCIKNIQYFTKSQKKISFKINNL